MRFRKCCRHPGPPLINGGRLHSNQVEVSSSESTGRKGLEPLSSKPRPRPVVDTMATSNEKKIDSVADTAHDLRVGLSSVLEDSLNTVKKNASV